MQEELLKKLFEKRQNDSGYHIILGQIWRRFGQNSKNHSALVYSAFEYRLAIERIVFEIYALMKRLRFVSKEEAKKLEKLTNVISQIMELVDNNKNFYRLMKFHAILFRTESKLRGSLAVPNISTLKNYWHSLSDYCHMQISPADSWGSQDFLIKGYDTLNQIEDYLWELKMKNYFGMYQMDQWQPEVIKLAEDFVNDRIDESSVKMRLELMKPIIMSRRITKLKP